MFRKYIIINSSKKTQCNILPTKLKILKLIYIDIWDKVFKNDPSEICGRQLLLSLGHNFAKIADH